MFELASEKLVEVLGSKLTYELTVPGKFTAVVIPVRPADAVEIVAAFDKYF
jgi:hypothetical protein